MITSLQNEQVKRARALHKQRSARAEAGRFVIEGSHLVEEALQANDTLEEVFFTRRFSESDEGARLLGRLSGMPVQPQLVHDSVMKSMCDTVTPQGIVAIAPMPEREIHDPLTFALIIDAVNDPGNMGTILRTAAGAGVPVVFLMPGSVDPFSPKVVRGAMGAHFRLPMRSLAWEQLKATLGNLPILLADSGEGVPCYQVDWTQPCALIVSSEARGASSEAEKLASSRVTIPMPGQIESLNVAMATGILIYEMLRQRLVHQENNS